MLTPAIRIKEKISFGEPVVGVMATDHVWPLLAELCKQSSLDYLTIDREHGYHSDEVVPKFARPRGWPIFQCSCE